MKKYMKIVVLITLLALALSACSSSSQSSTQQGNFPPGDMQGTPMAGGPQGGTQTAATAEVSATEVATITPTAAATAAATVTPTSVSVDLTVISAISCVAKPSESAAFAGYLKTGATLTALGRNSANTFYLIENPSYSGQKCWVWNNYVLINGISSELPVME